jgi:hypothetical protein
MALTPPDVTARFVAHDFFTRHPELPRPLQQELAVLVETALRSASRQERESCAAVCDARRALWLGTEGDANAPAQLRAEARARANEAAYLADAIRPR